MVRRVRFRIYDKVIWSEMVRLSSITHRSSVDLDFNSQFNSPQVCAPGAPRIPLSAHSMEAHARAKRKKLQREWDEHIEEETVAVIGSMVAADEVRSLRPRNGHTRPKGGNLRRHPAGSTWGLLLAGGVLSALPESAAGKLFRKRFRVTPREFKVLLAEVRDKGWWRRRQSSASGTPSSPVELLLLGTLKMLGRACTFDDLEELSAISAEQHRQFFLKYTQEAANEFDYECAPYVAGDPATLRAIETVYAHAGFPGCVGAGDGVHIAYNNASHAEKGRYVGKEGYPTIAYHVICDHHRRILACSRGYPGSFNDINIANLDNALVNIHSDPKFTEFPFEVYTGNQKETTATRGAYLIVDGGYAPWRELQCPVLHPTNSEAGWSEWLESKRKSIECVFGIVKKRFRILMVPATFKHTQTVDHIFKTCCRLHNMLLDVDGLASRCVRGGGPSHFEFTFRLPVPTSARHMSLHTLTTLILHFGYQSLRRCDICPCTP